MGLDVCVHEFVEIPDDVTTEDQLKAFCEKHDYHWVVWQEHHKNMPEKYIKEIPIECIDFEASFKARGLNADDWDLFMECGDTFGFKRKQKQATENPDGDVVIDFRDLVSDEKKEDEDTVYLKGDQLIPKTEMLRVWVYGREVGYQRKGANAQFYEDGKWDDNTIVSTKEMLLEDWKKYFSDPDDPYYGEKAREAFHYNIIKHFHEGKTFVWYC